MLKHALTIPLITLVLLACQPNTELNPQLTRLGSALTPTSKGPKPTEATGSIIASFDLGQNLNPADFQLIQPSDFKAQQQTSGGLQPENIQKAVLSILAQSSAEPVQAELTREEITQGWVFVFRNLPVGNAQITLKLLDSKNSVLLSQEQNVQIEANLVTPVNFLLDLESPSSSCQGSTCTGSLQVSVRARTQCLGLPRFPATGKMQEPLLFSLDSLQGSIEKFTVNFGDGSPVQQTASFPVRHSYATPGRYKVSVTLDGPGCKSPFEIGAYVSVN